MSEGGFRRFGQSDPPPAAEDAEPAGNAGGGFGSAGWREPSRDDEIAPITPAETEPVAPPAAPPPPPPVFDGPDPGAGSGFGGGGFGSGGAGGFGESAAPAQPAGVEDADTGEEKPKRRRKKAEPKHPRHTVAAVSATVRVVRDERGVPHIRAKREHDAWAALGFCVGQDRLWQMDLVRRQAMGRMAEIFGEAWLEHDALVRTVGIARRADVASRRVSGVAREVLAAYAGGVNAARAVVTVPEAAELGYEIEPWSVAASLSVELYWAWAAAREVWPRKLVASREAGAGRLANARRILPLEVDGLAGGDERRPLWETLDLHVLDGILPPEEFLSNRACGFALGGVPEKSALVGDLLGPPIAPPNAYPAQLEAPDFRVAGLSLPGTPIFLAGRNAHLCWVGSGLALDDVDLVAEDLDGIGNFRGRRGREKLAKRLELVRVRDGEDRRIEVIETRNGPLLSELPRQLASGDAALAHGNRANTPLAVRWGGNSLGTSVGGWVSLARAADASEAQAARNALAAGPAAFELAVLDSAGESVSFVAGMLPERAGDASMVVRGWHQESVWHRMAPAPEAVAQGLAVAGGGRPGEEACFAFEVAPDRRERLAEILAGETDIGAAAAMVQRDLADKGALRVLEALRATPEGGRELDGAWDGAAAADSRTAAMLWTLLVRALPARLFPPELFSTFAEQWWHAVPIACALATDADSEAAEALRLAWGDTLTAVGSDAGWAEASRLTRRHPLADREGFGSATLPAADLHGSLGSLSAARLRADRWPLEAGLLPGARLLCTPAVPEVSFALAGGTAGTPSSVHFTDQASSFDSGGWFGFSLAKELEGKLEELVP